MKAIILCADDYALNAEVDASIVQLVEMGRLSAVGCMTESPRWRDADNCLPALRDRIDIGLHFNLTQHFGGTQNSALAKQPLPFILRGALLGTLPMQAIADTLHTQLDLFESVMGDAPDFVDGHQHVHMFPRIRTVLLETLARRYRLRRPWLRRVNPSLERGPDWNKRALLALLNWRFAQSAQQLGFSCNRSFSGIYSLLPDADYPTLMRHWLTHAGNGEVLMCHPGQTSTNTKKNSAALADEIAQTRPRELAWLASREFGELLAREQISLTRFRDQ